MPLKLSIESLSSPLFLFPARMDDSSQATLRGEVHADTEVETEVGPLVIVWEGAIEQRKDDAWVDRNVVRTWLGRSADPGPILLPGLTRIPFEMSIASATAASRTTPFDRSVHTIFASFLDPAPDIDSTPLSPSASIEPQPIDTTRRSFMRRARDGRGSPARAESPVRSGASTPTGGKPWSLGRLFKAKHHRSEQSVEHDADEPSLPSACMPSKAYCKHTLDVITCFDNRWAVDRLQALDWVSEQMIPGLGHLKIAAYSDLLVAGSGFNMAIDFQYFEMGVSLHSIRIALLQQTDSVDEQSSETVDFTLYQLGQSYVAGRTPSSDEFIWRESKGLEPDSGLATFETGSSDSVEYKVFPRFKSAENSLRIATFCRLPSPAIGALARWGFYAGFTSNTVHHLRFEVYYAAPSGNHLGAENTMRRYWIDHHVGLNDCIASPTNIKVPPYTSEPEVADAFSGNAHTEQQTSAFHQPSKTTRVVNAKTTEMPGAQGDSLVHRVQKHKTATGGSCMCFCSDIDVAKVVGKLEAVEVATELEPTAIITDKYIVR